MSRHVAMMGARQKTKATSRSRAVDPAEALDRLDKPRARDMRAYADHFRERLAARLDGSESGAALAVAFSRTAVETFPDASPLPATAASRVRVNTLDEVAAEHGLDRLRGGVSGADLQDDRDDHAPAIPRGRAVPGERARRSGARR